MRKPMLFFLLIFSFTENFAQSSRDEVNTMIDSAINLVYHFNKEDSIRLSEKTNIFRNIYLFDAQERPLNYLHDALDNRFSYMDIYNIRAFKALKKGVRAWKIITKLIGNSFSIVIIDYTITYKRHNYKFAKGGSGTVVFELDCGSREWKFKSFSYHDS